MMRRCPRLQRLWLFSNQITRIENVDDLGDLRELWLQVRWFAPTALLTLLEGQSDCSVIRCRTSGELASVGLGR